MKRVQLAATPSNPGQVKLTGIQFSLSGTVCGCRNFEGKGARLNKTKAHWLQPTYAPDFRLIPLVIPPMPRIEGSLEGVSESILAGEVINASLKLFNTSGATLFRLFVGMSAKGGALTFGTSALVEGATTEVKMTRAEGAATNINVAAGDTVTHVVELGLPDGLAAGSVISIPLCYSASSSEAGKQVCVCDK